MEGIQSILNAPQGPAQALKEYLRKKELELKERHRRRTSGMEITTEFTALVDATLKGLFEKLSLEHGVGQKYAVVALGGYGRRELNIRSDIDLMILYEKKITPELEALTQKILYLLWDSGMDVGFSIRTTEECIEVATEDTKTQTALLDARHLWGDRELFERFLKKVEKELFSGRGLKRFIEDKLEERRQRHIRYGGSVFILEPNVKEGEGGLRDIHTASWVVRAKLKTPFVPKEQGLISEREERALTRAIDMLNWIRNELHFETGRKTDQLSFDHQERIAPLLGFKDTHHELSVEAFMRKYYEMATTIKEVSERILMRTLDRKSNITKGAAQKKPVDQNFYITDGFLFTEDTHLFEREPVAIMKVFEYSQKHGVELHQSLRDLVLANLHVVDELKSSPEMAESFLNILRGGEVYPTLQEMHRLGVLGRYIPEFGAIRCKVQHDLYHIYTVDTHTLLAIRELDGLKERYREEFPLLCRLLSELKDPMPLYLAVLLHDAGKALGRPHAIKGAELVPKVAERLGIDEEAEDTVRFLVREHLILADTAQHRDIHDEKLVIEFARRIVDPERLNLLYLLTFADIRAVGPDVWNQWKGALFQELYFEALKVIERGSFEPEDHRKRIASVRKKVEEQATWASPDEVAEYFRLLPPRYFLANSPEKIAKHMKVVKRLDGSPCIMDVEQVEEREYTELVIATYDIHGLFSMITGILSANSVNILGAQINTLRNGIALDVLQVNNAYGGLLTDGSKLKRIEEELMEAISGRLHVERLVTEKCRRPSILDRKEKPPVPTRIEVDNNVSDVFTIIDIRTQDRIGLLYDISHTLTQLSLFIYVAKISTRGDEAADIFYVRDIFGQKITDEKKITLIKDTLYEVLTGDETGR
ncbi:MAG TPA: [protein-PII] uridylyltransferase [Deltaproteobacteria bacterium]|nr:[protein-PII] uridylyltransferase [Deltaproteobacteria bacterium]